MLACSYLWVHFLLLYHASLGKHVKKKAKYLVDSFIVGIGTLVFLILSTVIFLLGDILRNLYILKS